MNARTIVAVPIVILDTAILAPIEVLVSLASGKSRLIDRINRVWARVIALGAGLEVEASGLDNVDCRRSYVVVSNHQSHLDTIALFLTCPVPLRMLAKKELFRIPLFGQALARTGHVRIDRDRKGMGIRWAALQRAARDLREAGRSLMVFAEGTRSSDGTLGPFKKGAFELATTLDLPILPVVITGTRHVLPARRIEFHPGRARVDYLPCVEPRGRGMVDLRDEVRGMIARELEAAGSTGAGTPAAADPRA